jgi:nicotinate-nucleotide--dimethylbenzimidazole phosphoribosyltransferase
MPKDRFTIQAVDASLDAVIQLTLDNKTKPRDSLGQVEAVAAQIARIQQTLSPQLSRLNHCVFAADHGVCAEGISRYPTDMTRQMVLDFAAGGNRRAGQTLYRGWFSGYGSAADCLV